jgi:[ribosomal protein S18]-alanine N-acetyltransferase
MGVRWAIRPAVAEDAAAIAAAERECFADPWSESGVAETLHNGTSLGLVAEARGRLAGYLLARMIAGEAEILTLAVVPWARRRGLGRALLDAALERLAAVGNRAVFLEVRESNEGARELYLGAGFRPVGVRPGYYRKPRESALVLRRALGAAGA